MNPATFQKRILSWYKKEARHDLPWRKTRDPYRIWISEIMLQQTQVAKVIPYYNRFLKRFPTVSHLAKAPLTRVLESWAGLGYYSRAKNLHAAAKRIVRLHGGRLPSTIEELLDLPGVGRYTAGAIASIAFGQAAPILDGNVTRVLSRYFGISTPIQNPATQKKLWRLSEELLPKSRFQYPVSSREDRGTRPGRGGATKAYPGGRYVEERQRRHGPAIGLRSRNKGFEAGSKDLPGTFNQALMELGALLCTPRGPACSICPLKSGCFADKNRLQETLPRPKAATTRKKITYLCGILERRGKILTARRPLTGLLPGLWEFPGGECLNGDPKEKALARLLKERLGIGVRPKALPLRIRQLLTHREIEIRPFLCRSFDEPRRPIWYREIRWVAKKELERLPMTSGMLKVAKQL